MTYTVAINGFGRIGRCVLRAMAERGVEDMELRAINDLTSPETLAHLLKYDSVHGRFRADIGVEGDMLRINGTKIRVTAASDPADLPWQDIDLVFDCTGKFKTKAAASSMLQAGARRVLISAPADDVDRTVVYGVNHTDLTAGDEIVSNASCTTNCLAPVAMILHQTFGIRTGYMTTVHAYTGDQPTLDRPHKDFYRARAAAMSMIPTSTGAARALSQVLPDLAGRIEGSAIRVPTANVSVVDLAVMTDRLATRDEVNAVMRAAAAEGPLAGILSYEEDPLVSIDFNHDPHSGAFAAAQTTVTRDGLLRVLVWYDNEWGFSNRMIDTGREMLRRMQGATAKAG